MKRIPFGLKASNAMNVQNNGNGAKNSKRKAETSPGKEVKRCALGDISNAKKSVIPVLAKGKAQGPLKVEPIRVTRQSVKSSLPPKIPSPKQGVSELPTVKVNRTQSVRNHDENTAKPKLRGRKSESSVAEESDDSILYKTANDNDLSDSVIETFDEKRGEDLKEDKQLSKIEKKLPEGVVDFDDETGDDPFQVALYAAEIFEYYKFRELKFPVSKYLSSQTELNKGMRSILVDWLVEVQESFELNHETLYLAVKIVDLFLGKVKIPRDKLQLVGTTAFWIAAKFDERVSPSIDDFCYICDDAYPMAQVLSMEMQILKALKYDIGFPLSYRFLRRYARVAKLEMEALTLARFILESALMEYDFIDVRDSMMAGAALWLALYMKGKPWCPMLTHYAGYKSTDLFDLVNRLLAVLRNPPNNVKTIRAKYSHTVFYEVAKIPLPEEIRI